VNRGTDRGVDRAATRGRFVVLEGGDGSGKSTQAARLAAWLRSQGIVVLETFEPGAGPTGALLREVLLHGPEPLAPVAEALLMAADRAQHVATGIEPALARGEWVVCDRYVPSSLVYQGVVRGLGVDAVEALSEVATVGLAPDVVVLLDVSDSTADARRAEAGRSEVVRAEPDRLEQESAEFHASVRAAYRDLAPSRAWIVVAADDGVDQVAERVRSAVAPLLAG
jgi:dTMP kinase